MDSWQQELTAQVARNIEHFRLRRGLTRTELAARCTALGLPTKRPALAALLDGSRHTITLQEIVVLAEALDTSAAELIVPLHTGEATIFSPTQRAHAFDAADRLFAIDGTAPPYRPFIHFRRAITQFDRANRRLAETSHALAVGTIRAGAEDGRPHPASEILAAEAALSRLLAAKRDLVERALQPPPLSPQWDALLSGSTPVDLPVLELLPESGRALLPMSLFRLHPDQLPSARVVGE